MSTTKVKPKIGDVVEVTDGKWCGRSGTLQQFVRPSHCDILLRDVRFRCTIRNIPVRHVVVVEDNDGQ